jgi:hypothetical protein
VETPTTRYVFVSILLLALLSFVVAICNTNHLLLLVHALAHTVNVHYSIYCQTVKHYGIGSVQIKVSIFNGLCRVVYQNTHSSHHSMLYHGGMVGQNRPYGAHGEADLGQFGIF